MLEVHVYDVAGRLVQVLDRGLRPAGGDTLRWDGRDRSSEDNIWGIDLCRFPDTDARWLVTSGDDPVLSNE